MSPFQERAIAPLMDRPYPASIPITIDNYDEYIRSNMEAGALTSEEQEAFLYMMRARRNATVETHKGVETYVEHLYDPGFGPTEFFAHVRNRKGIKIRHTTFHGGSSTEYYS